MSWQAEHQRKRPPKETRTGIDDEMLSESLEQWPSGTDKLMMALEALVWVNKYGIRVMRALRERLDEELLTRDGALQVRRYDVDTRTWNTETHPPHPYQDYFGSCKTCGQMAEHLLHQPIQPKETDP